MKGLIMAATMCMSCFFPPTISYESSSYNSPLGFYVIGDRVALRSDMRKHGVVVSWSRDNYTIRWADGTTSIKQYEEVLPLRN